MRDDDALLPADKESILGRYAGVVRVFTSGNQQKAASLRPLALTQLGLLRNQLALGGELTGARRTALPDGTMIETLWNGTINIVRIVTPGDEAEEEEQLAFPYLSGLQEIAEVSAPLDGEFKFASQFWPAWQVPGGREQQWYQYNLGFDSFAWPETPTDVEVIEADPDVRFIYDWIVPTLPNIDAGPLGLKWFPLWPGMYTGSLRLVVQKLLGYKRHSPFSLNSGLWTPDIANTFPDERQRWIIEIDRIQGITAYPVFFENELDTEGVDAATLTDGKERARYDYALAAGFTVPTVISTNPSDVFGNEDGIKCRYQVMAPEELMDVFYYGVESVKWTMTSWYPNWAFSYSGNEAQIVLFSSKTYSINDSACFTQRYKIAFNQGTFLIENLIVDYPVSASVHLMDEDYLYTDRFNYDLYAPINKPYQEQIYFETPLPVPEPRDAPLYVFYTRDDEEVVLKRSDVGVVSIEESTQVGLDCDTQGCVFPCVYCDQSIYGSQCADSGCQRYFTSIAELCFEGYIETRVGAKWTSTYYCDRTFGKETNYSGDVSGTYRYVEWTETVAPANNAICNLLFYDFVIMKSVRVSTGHQTITANHNEDRTYRVVTILPLYDREGFYQLQLRETVYDSAFNRTNQTVAIHRCNTIVGPYVGMPEVSAVGAYAYAAGVWATISTDTDQPPDTVDKQYVYIGSIDPENYGAEDSVITIDNPAEGTVFVDGMQAIAAVEMFTGRAILAPHPPTVDDGEGGEKANLWVSGKNINGTGGDSYPAANAYRPQNLLSPKYFCFIGDGTIYAKSGPNVDMNAINYLGRS